MRPPLQPFMPIMRIVGVAWVAIVGPYIALQYFRVLFTDGLPFGQRVLTILNLWNLAFIAMALMPGIVCILITAHFSSGGARGNDG